jgi:hypothetical protein
MSKFDWGWGYFSVQVGGEVVAEAELGLAPWGVEAADKKWLPVLPLEFTVQ